MWKYVLCCNSWVTVGLFCFRVKYEVKVEMRTCLSSTCTRLLLEMDTESRHKHKRKSDRDEAGDGHRKKRKHKKDDDGEAKRHSARSKHKAVTIVEDDVGMEGLWVEKNLDMDGQNVRSS